ncbi:MAG: hypothetical protein NT026_01245 [Candidatus Staskawiczbacteria bacterium]|nr:hypothetical protein [Candidatus Staskawiczbacteria bacterium]
MPGIIKECLNKKTFSRYSILKQSIGSDIIYDFDKSISFEGDSGPYLQYAYTRALSVLKKAKNEGMEHLIIIMQKIKL